MIGAHPQLKAQGCEANSPYVDVSGGGIRHRYICTRAVGHPGSHMGNGVDEVVAIWDDEFFWISATNEWVLR